MHPFKIFLCLLFLTACQGTSLVYRQPPQVVIPQDKTMLWAGSVENWNLDFTAVCYREADSVRMVILSVFGVKLADLKVWPHHAEVYHKQEQFPTVALEAFVRFARENFFSKCPPSTVQYKDAPTHAIFRAQLKGESACY